MKRLILATIITALVLCAPQSVGIIVGLTMLVGALVLDRMEEAR